MKSDQHLYNIGCAAAAEFQALFDQLTDPEVEILLRLTAQPTPSFIKLLAAAPRPPQAIIQQCAALFLGQCVLSRRNHTDQN